MKSCFEHLSNLHFCLSVKQWQEVVFELEYLTPRNVSWLSPLGVSSVCTWEPMFHILSHFEFVWVGFESLKVGQLLFSCICTLRIFLGGLVWHVISFDQLTKMIKFILNYIVWVRYLLFFNFELMRNPFDQFSNVIPFAIFRVSLVFWSADQSGALFEMVYLCTHHC